MWVAVWHRGEILLIKNAYRNTITLPGGGMDGSEGAVAAALRELGEEVGIEPPEGDLRFWGQYLSRFEYKRDHINLFELELDYKPAILLDNREVTWAAIRSPQRALEMNLFPALRTHLDDKLSGRRPGLNTADKKPHG